MEKRMHDIMACTMESGSVFQSMHDWMKADINHWLDNMEDNLNNHIIEMCAELERQVETARGTEAEEVSRNHPRDLKAAKKALTRARKALPKLQRLVSVGLTAVGRLGYVV